MANSSPRWFIVCMLLQVGVIAGRSADAFANINCPSPQYVVVGTTGRLDCSFPQRFTAVYWKYEHGDETFPLVGLEGTVKREHGYENGKYEIHSNGSLIINEVGVEDEGVYVVMLVTSDDHVKHLRITLETTVLSQQNHPYINLCGKDDQCFRRYDPGTPIYCSYNHSRPAVILNWYIRHPSNDTLLRASFDCEPDSNEAFSSISRLNMEDFAVGSFVFLVCVTGGPQLTPHTIESWLILDISPKINEILNDVSISKKDVPLYGHSVLPCGEIQPTLDGAVVWLFVDLTGLTSTLVYSMYHTPHRRYYTYSTVDFDEHSIAIELFRVTREDEKMYVCLSTDGTHTEVMAAYQLAVFVTPSRPYILVYACFNDMAHCQLSSREGTLTCCISRVFNNVELATNVRDKSKISTSNEKQRRQSIGDGFVDHCVTFDYELHQDVCEYPVSVFCYARTEGGLEIVPRKEITFMNQEICQSGNLATFLSIAFSTWGALVVVIVVLLIIIVCLCIRKQKPQ